MKKVLVLFLFLFLALGGLAFWLQPRGEWGPSRFMDSSLGFIKNKVSFGWALWVPDSKTGPSSDGPSPQKNNSQEKDVNQEKDSGQVKYDGQQKGSHNPLDTNKKNNNTSLNSNTVDRTKADNTASNNTKGHHQNLEKNNSPYQQNRTDNKMMLSAKALKNKASQDKLAIAAGHTRPREPANIKDPRFEESLAGPDQRALRQLQAAVEPQPTPPAPHNKHQFLQKYGLSWRTPQFHQFQRLKTRLRDSLIMQHKKRNLKVQLQVLHDVHLFGVQRHLAVQFDIMDDDLRREKPKWQLNPHFKPNKFFSHHNPSGHYSYWASRWRGLTLLLEAHTLGGYDHQLHDQLIELYQALHPR